MGKEEVGVREKEREASEKRNKIMFVCMFACERKTEMKTISSVKQQ